MEKGFGSGGGVGVGSAVCSNRQEGRGEPRGHEATEAEGGRGDGVFGKDF